MKSSTVSFLFSALLILINFIFLYAIVGYKKFVSYQMVPGLTVGMIGFASVITFAILLTWAYVLMINWREKK
ncbi:MAG: hypothetical protein Q8Q56_04350 [Alphaproteobacteria bacterium]|nr:hypothetical protein [Alphaproteobacteria bacterium]